MTILKCRNCKYFDEWYVRQPDGSYKPELSCRLSGKQLEDFDVKADKCKSFKFSIDAYKECVD